MKSEGVNLIGENFMSGLKVVFDRERKVLGWKSFDCYNMGNSRSNLPVNPNPSGVPPRPSLGPNNYTPEATKGASSNGTQSRGMDLRRKFPDTRTIFIWHNTLALSLMRDLAKELALGGGRMT
ncbi:Aspartyl protease family protein 1 [Zea mays]|uniref:Aspartyl protease family protein 1 n=1 Tax=Zea mays TaxID=4577 RepID=A0A317YM29_MAIZE|nr:Aspartyl protease family protein 1 [Zea mays]